MLGVPLWVVGAATLVIGAVPLLLWALAGPRPRPVTSMVAGGGPADQRSVHLEVGALERAILPAARAIGRRARRLTPAGWVDALERRIRFAGSPPRWTLERTLVGKLGLAGLGLSSLLVWGERGLTTSTILLTVLMTLSGYVLPDVILYGRARERQQLIRLELPDTLDQLTISVEAGLGFDAALKRVSQTGDGPLAEELRRVMGDIKVGVPRADALRHLLERTDIPELRHFVVALQQAEKYGLPIARVLRIQSGELRVKRRQRAEEQAMKIPVKIVFPLVLCIFPALFVVLLGPAMVRVMRTLL